MAILLLLFSSSLQSSIGPIRAEQVPPSSSVIGWQYWGQPGATLAPVSCTLQCKQLHKCTSVQLNIGLSKVCAQVSTKTPLLTQFCLDPNIAETEVPLISNFLPIFDMSKIELTRAFQSFFHGQSILQIVVLCWGLMSAPHKVTTDFTLTPLPSNGHCCAGPWFFARCANSAFLTTNNSLVNSDR